MAGLDRQEIIATNKSLRLIKNELEHLLEKGVVDDNTFDSIMQILPTESSLSSAGTPAARQTFTASPAPSRNPVASPPPPVNSMANLSLGGAHNQTAAAASPAPPAYNATGPPSLPSRNGPPPPPPGKPVIAHARALYKYQAADDRDLSFERDDKVAVFEYMNDDWWMGKNQRTGAEGIFPKNYVEIDNSNNEKAGGFYAPAQPTYNNNAGGYPQPPQGQNPYNSSVPPMAVAGGSGDPNAAQGSGGKGGEMGKKIGKKLGNAAIFGAGATLGGNLVNSIF